jgi:hypothetical protein
LKKLIKKANASMAVSYKGSKSEIDASCEIFSAKGCFKEVRRVKALDQLIVQLQSEYTKNESSLPSSTPFMLAISNSFFVWHSLCKIRYIELGQEIAGRRF